MKRMTKNERKLCNLSILGYIDEVCSRNNLRYYLSAGTLLGAIRHKGFIPWDDDIDVMMPREDYERLFKVWPQNGIYKALCNNNTAHFPYAFGKVIDNRTLKLEPFRKQFQVIGVDVDVFPLDNFPDDETESIRYLNEIARIQKKLNKHIISYSKASTPLRTIVHNLIILMYRFQEWLGITSVEKIVHQLSECAQRYNNQDTEHCGITTLYHYGLGERYQKSWFDESYNVTFEGKNYPAPVGYDEYLRNMYGSDYMQLPPEEKRKSHHTFIAYWT